MKHRRFYFGVLWVTREDVSTCKREREAPFHHQDVKSDLGKGM